MEFKERQSIYLQIAEYVCDQVVNGKWLEGDKIPSIRELAADIVVNPNTVVRTYANLEEQGIIVKKRGIGYFVAPGAVKLMREKKKKAFIERELPELFKSMSMLEITLEDINDFYEKYSKKSGDEIDENE